MSTKAKQELQENNPAFKEKLHEVGEKVEQQSGKATTTLPIKDQKKLLANLVGTFIIKEPKFAGGTDSTASLIRDTVKAIVEEDPEFIWKLAYYVRSKLYLRSTTNNLLAIALQTPKCLAFQKKWFNACINLPSDLLEVVEVIRADHNGKITAAMRRSFNSKFTEFNVYQFGKYDNSKKLKRKKRKQRLKEEAKKQKTGEGEDPKKEEEKKEEEKKPEEKKPEEEKKEGEPAKSETAKPLQPMTLKQLIRSCHTSQPAEVVMSIGNHHYPKDPEAFKKSGMTGEWDATKVGQRMKIPIPLTWETELSAKGNSAVTWENLIDKKSLPFMAMMRNLRNLCEAGISEKHHKVIQDRLKDEGQVTNSKQLPFRFLSAFEAVSFDDATLAKLKEATETGQEFTEKVYKFKTPEGKPGKVKKKKPSPKYAPTQELLQEYRNCLEEAIRIAITNNLPPLRGVTGVFMDVSGSMDTRLAPPRIKAKAGNLHEDSTGKQLRNGEDFDLDDFFSMSGKECTNVLELSMVWKEASGQDDVDLDLSVMMLNAKGEEIGYVNYCQLNAPGIQHSGDITEAPDGAEELVRIELDKVKDDVAAIYCTVNSYTHQPFDSLGAAAFALRDASNVKEEIAAFPLCGGKRGIVAAALLRKPGTTKKDETTGTTRSSWTFRVVNDSTEGHAATVSSLGGLIKQNYLDFIDGNLPGRTLLEMGLLFGLCTKYMSESCTLYGFASTCECLDEKLEGDTILPNIRALKEHVNTMKRGTTPPIAQLNEWIEKRKYIDTLIILTDAVLPDADKFRATLDKYRQEVNPAVLTVTIDLLGTGQSVTDPSPEKPMDLQFSGFSDQLLRYIAGYDQDQLADIESLTPPEKKKK
eukprot:TRINITY_DN63758_c1_g3_i1.p1 TRINITY_DN63758_c1_g3~~TRINITY_DN63758_c1_g3_i1.p1  ORF type:complete len:864 (+),score=166.18 TRINITY_DN63758_c1_g3_i1:21-2612(+)